MDIAQTHILIRYVHALEPRLGRRDDEEMALAVAAWHAELPYALTLDDARRIAHELHRQGTIPTAGAIGRRWDERSTPLHQQGITTSPRPVGGMRRPAVEPPAAILSAITPKQEAAARPDAVRSCPRPPAVPCPYCNALPRQHCTTVAGARLTHRLNHPSRDDAAGGLDVSHIQRRAEHAPPPPPDGEDCPEPPEWSGPLPDLSRDPLR